MPQPPYKLPGGNTGLRGQALLQGWPMHERHINITAGQAITLTGNPAAEATDTVLPVTYDKFATMAQPGDTVYIGRLACGIAVTQRHGRRCGVHCLALLRGVCVWWLCGTAAGCGASAVGLLAAGRCAGLAVAVRRSSGSCAAARSARSVRGVRCQPHSKLVGPCAVAAPP